MEMTSVTVSAFIPTIYYKISLSLSLFLYEIACLSPIQLLLRRAHIGGHLEIFMICESGWHSGVENCM